MLTKDILFCMNILTLAGFLVMGLSLTLHRTGNTGVPLSIGVMCAGTALVVFGLFAVDLQNDRDGAMPGARRNSSCVGPRKFYSASGCLAG